jgi:hypothetical protein
MSEQDELDRRLMVIRVEVGVALAALLVLSGLMLSGARAAELPCPPKHSGASLDESGTRKLIEAHRQRRQTSSRCFPRHDPS